MEVAVANGRISFRRYSSLGIVGPIPGDVDAELGHIRPVISDAAIPPGYVSLKSPEVRVAAADFTILETGDIRKVGWVNVIQESERRYHYQDGLVITERVDQLPTWDGGPDDAPPFYFGSWFATHDEDEDEAGCAAVLAEDEAEDILFNDAPCMPPSYHCYEENGIPLGKFKISPPGYVGNLMTRISGADRYVACLTVVDNANQHRVVWSVPWDVTFLATVAENLAGAPVVTLGGTARTRLNVAPNHDAQVLVDTVRTRASGESLKRYEKNRAMLYVRDRHALHRTRSVGEGIRGL